MTHAPVAVRPLPQNALPAERLFRRAAARPGAFWHDNAFRAAGRRLSAIGCRPAFTLRWGPTTGLRTDPPGLLPAGMHPFEALRRVWADYALPADAPHRRFADFANAGYFGYELASLLEPKVPARPEDVRFPDLYWAFYDRVVVIDPEAGSAHAVAIDVPLWETLGLPLPPAEARAAELAEEFGSAPPACEAILPGSSVGEAILPRASDGRRDRRSHSASPPALQPDFSPEEYRRAVARVIDYIRAGDIFQANLSQRFAAAMPTSGPELYLRVRDLNRPPHAGYLALAGGAEILSASPELFLHVADDGLVTTRPIKGTRPRSADPAEDERLRAELSNSPKDRAELTMIVDLLRNDLGRVCGYGSVRVTEPRVLECYATVHHAVATVTGRLADGRDRLDLLAGSLPGGSITGAPKVRAMQIIRELERSPRRVYTGSLGRFGTAGGMDLNIAIRTLLAADGRVSFGVGGGVVADSDPEAEYQETLHKAAGMIRALGCVGRREAESPEDP
jgi:para-aminobenzoate synthetase component 1